MLRKCDKLAKYCIQTGVKIIANQRVVGTNIKRLFRDYGIIVLERFGSDRIEKLRRISRSIGEEQTMFMNTPSLLTTLSAIPNCDASDLQVFLVVKILRPIHYKHFYRFQMLNSYTKILFNSRIKSCSRTFIDSLEK